MKVKQFKDILNNKLNMLDDDMEICVFNDFSDYYEPVLSISIDDVRKVDNSFSEKSGNKFIESYKKEFLKQDIIKVATINY